MTDTVDLEKQQRTIEEAPRTSSGIRTSAVTSQGSEHFRDSVADDQTVVESPGGGDEVDAPGEPELDEKTENSQYLVKWDGPDDPENPKVSPPLPHPPIGRSRLMLAASELVNAIPMVPNNGIRTAYP